MKMITKCIGLLGGNFASPNPKEGQPSLISILEVWRLIEKPDPLCARIRQAMHYPHQHILEAGPKKGSSFT